MSDEITVRVASYGEGRCLMMTYIDPMTGKKVARTSGETNRRKAERAAGVWQDELNTGRYKPAAKITWEEFRTRYEKERLATQSASSRKTAATAFNLVERILNPDRLSKLTTGAMSVLIGKLRDEKLRDSTAASYLRTLKAAIRWAHRMGLLVALPQFDMPRAGDAKARPVTAEEFDRMLAKVPEIRPKDAAVWSRLLNGLWLSGLRLGEALRLSWDADAPFAVDLSGKYPAFAIEARAQKGRRDERLPMTPDMAEWLLKTPEAERSGPVFNVPSLRDGQPMCTTKTGMVIGKIGEAARVVVAKDPETGAVKYASAHDLRRSFGTRWAKKVMPAVLQRLMRHKSIGTTMRYYVGLESDDVAAGLWANYVPSGNTFGNTGPGAVKEPEAESPASGDARLCESKD